MSQFSRRRLCPRFCPCEVGAVYCPVWTFCHRKKVQPIFLHFRFWHDPDSFVPIKSIASSKPATTPTPRIPESLWRPPGCSSSPPTLCGALRRQMPRSSASQNVQSHNPTNVHRSLLSLRKQHHLRTANSKNNRLGCSVAKKHPGCFQSWIHQLGDGELERLKAKSWLVKNKKTQHSPAADLLRPPPSKNILFCALRNNRKLLRFNLRVRQTGRHGKRCKVNSNLIGW